MQIEHLLTIYKQRKISTLQTSFTFQLTPNAGDFLNNISNLQSTLSNLQSQFLAALETHRHDRRLCGVARQLGHFDVDVRGAARGHCGGCAQQSEEEPAGSGRSCEGVESRAEGGDCADGNGHLDGWPCRS